MRIVFNFDQILNLNSLFMPTSEFHIGESHDHLLLSKFSINDFTGEQRDEINEKYGVK